jgi:hypothetical protein
MDVSQLPQPGVIYAATIRPADLALPASHPVDISHLLDPQRMARPAS